VQGVTGSPTTSVIRRSATAALLSIAILVIVSVVPTLFGVEEGEVRFTGAGISLTWQRFTQYVAAGRPDRFYVGMTPRSLVRDVPRFALISLSIALPAALCALLVGAIIPVARRYARSPLPSVLLMLAAVPMFVLAILLQAAGLRINELVGTRVFQIAYVGGFRSPVLLPMISAMLPLSALVARMVDAEVGRQMKAEHYRAAAARGIGRASLLFRHAGSGALHSVETVLPRIGSSTLATMFIVERIFNLPGLSSLLLNFAFSREFYRYPRILEEVTRSDGTVYLRSTFGGGIYVVTAQLQMLVVCAILIALVYTLVVLSCLMLVRAAQRSLQ